jgi:hypothetical protein
MFLRSEGTKTQIKRVIHYALEARINSLHSKAL